MFQTTRRRLALWYTAITAVLLLLFAIGVYLYVRSTLIERIDDTLNHVVEIVERSLVIESVNSDTGKYRINVEASFRGNADTAEDDHIDLEWFSPTGELLWSTLSEPLDIPIHVNRTGETVYVVRGGGLGGQGTGDRGQGTGDRGQGIGDKEKNIPTFPLISSAGSEFNAEESGILLRQVTQRVEIGKQVLGYLRVSHPWFEVTKPSRQLIFDLALGTGLMVVSVGASGWFLSGKAMEPVRESYQRLKQFTADASHELRSPITLIQTNVQVALTDLELAQDSPTLVHYRQQLKLIERLTQRLGRLVNDLLFLARQDSGISKESFSPCPLDALLMEVVEEQQLLATEKNITLTFQFIDPHSPEISPEMLENWFSLMGNWDQLVRLFTNLIGNALRYTPSGGRVNVELARIEGINRVSGLLYYSGPHLQIKIGDTGIGIPKEALPRLFDRFYRVDPARTHTNEKTAAENATGSGLGLAIAQAIVENHQGQIQVDSVVGVGTTITVTLPITDET
ncbi:sensor histidine kinase [Chlorogloeopsis fritschii PCC 9212]|uniref:histidine kinase n=1 Tax=Chlorogloeopsis fritschii PCC 6912 TaxID=211165 RepID=A0A3S5K2C5_CHLFR|nr:HAMP domain-containing sensor histidine kinase [Chlorogloeopsis fritschii]RUR84553.1 two-component sensor histidine kinase [Chlorogloeopsis fritschii PCC 6912]